MNIPQDLRYSKDHEWVRVEGDVAVVGITDFAQSELGDIVFVEVETEDETLEVDAVFGTIEAVKTVSDMFMPIAGTVHRAERRVRGQPCSHQRRPLRCRLDHQDHARRVPDMEPFDVGRGLCRGGRLRPAVKPVGAVLPALFAWGWPWWRCTRCLAENWARTIGG